MSTNTLRVLIHTPHGALFTGLALAGQPVLAGGVLAMILYYQHCEDTHGGGCSWPDIQGYMWGAMVPAGAWLIWRFLS